MTEDDLEPESDERLVLADLLNHVLDKGIVISGDVTISVADIDLIRVGLGVFISSIQTDLDRSASARPAPDVDLPVLRDSSGA